MGKLKTQEQFIKEIKNIYGDKYILDKTVYQKDNIHVIITCPIHGDFLVTPNNFLQGKECPKCKHRSTAYTTEEWVSMAKEKYPQNDYSITKYVKQRVNIFFICPIHGVIEQRPDLHLKNGCYKCAKEKAIKKSRKTNEQFLLETKIIHGEKYEYLDDYINFKTPIRIKCNAQTSLTIPLGSKKLYAFALKLGTLYLPSIVYISSSASLDT